MLTRMLFSLVLVATLAGCGGDTSWYVCSGSAEFCGTDRTVDDDKPVGVAAIVVAQTTPGAIDSGLQDDGLETTLSQAPELVAGWLIAGSLAVLADDSDNAMVSGFLDDNRYWLTVNQDSLITGDDALSAGLALLAAVADQRDPLVAGAADQRIEKMLSLSPADSSSADGAAMPASADLLDQAQTLLSGFTQADCCSAGELMAAAVLLCESEALTAKALENNFPNAEVDAACQAARDWLQKN